MKTTTPSPIYGPVASWRLGKSLGVDLLCVDSICSFECVYCQLGKINRVTTTRKVFVETAKVIDALSNADWQDADIITFSGSGEPTLARNLGETITAVKQLTVKPIAVLTNSTLLYDPKVREELAQADRVFCKLDAWTDDVLKRIDRPHPEITLDSILDGLVSLRNEFDGFMAIQTMILRIPDDDELTKLASMLAAIRPDEVQLNLPNRPIPAEYSVETRGNDIKPDKRHTQLRTVSNQSLTAMRRTLTEQTGLTVITR